MARGAATVDEKATMRHDPSMTDATPRRGRPPATGITRRESIHLRLSYVEAGTIREAAELSGTEPSAFARDAALAAAGRVLAARQIKAR